MIIIQHDDILLTLGEGFQSYGKVLLQDLVFHFSHHAIVCVRAESVLIDGERSFTLLTVIIAYRIVGDGIDPSGKGGFFLVVGIERGKHLEKDLRGNVLGICQITHLSSDVTEDLFSVFKIDFFHYVGLIHPRPPFWREDNFALRQH